MKAFTHTKLPSSSDFVQDDVYKLRLKTPKSTIVNHHSSIEIPFPQSLIPFHPSTPLRMTFCKL